MYLTSLPYPSSIMRKKTAAVRKSCKDAEFVYLEPPHILEKVDFVTGTATLADLDSDGATLDAEEQSEETTPRAWFTANHVEQDDKRVLTTYNKIDETFAYLHDFLIRQEKPFDGVLGFSQGGCVAALLAALLEKPGLHPNFPAHPNLKPLKFAIFAGGFKAHDESLHHFYPLSLPTLHVIGKNDVIVTEERSRTLVRECEDNRVEYHEGGHFIPSKANWRNFFNEYISSFKEGGLEGDVPPPAANASAASSIVPTREGTPAVEAGEIPNGKL